MATEVTLSLPDDTYHRAEQSADFMGRRVSEVLTDTISISFPPLEEQPLAVELVSSMPGSEVLGLASSQMASLPSILPK